MHIDLTDPAPAPDRIRADAAVIGAGVAGITMARRLLAAGLSVVLLESGGIDYEAETAALNDGASVGMPYYPLKDARLRFFGGTSAIWGGRCAEFDPIDLERRAWVPHSGWPIGWDELSALYPEARALFGLPPRAPGLAETRAAGAALPEFDPNRIAMPLWSFDDAFDRFRFDRCRDLIDHARCTLVTHATVREIVAMPGARGIARLDVVAPDRGRIAVEADDYVLAAGGIENARLLLASRSVMPAGLGNGHDQVGRYFMEHPHARGGRIVDGPVWRLLDAFARRDVAGQPVAPLIAPGRAAQERLGLLNTSLTIAPRRPASGSESWAMRAYLSAKHRMAPDQRGRTLWKATKRTVRWLQRHSDPLRPWLLNKAGRLDVALVVRAEQAPDPASRITLSPERDAAGVQRAVLDWRTGALDKASVAGLVDLLGEELARLGLGRVEPAAWLGEAGEDWVTDPLISTHPIGGYHHIGTTRMSASPRTGVTDAEGRVHGLGNLHVAGSSLFPTSGWANPTLTIVALALRSADAIVRRRGWPAISKEELRTAC